MREFFNGVAVVFYSILFLFSIAPLFRSCGDVIRISRSSSKVVNITETSKSVVKLSETNGRDFKNFSEVSEEEMNILLTQLSKNENYLMDTYQEELTTTPLTVTPNENKITTSINAKHIDKKNINHQLTVNNKKNTSELAKPPNNSYRENYKTRAIDFSPKLYSHAPNAIQSLQDISLLESIFGNSSKFIKSYKSIYYETGNVKEAREGLIPSELKDLDNNHIGHDFAPIFYERKFNKKEANLLSKLTGKYIPPTNSTDYIKDYIFITTSKNNDILIRSINGRVEYDIEKPLSELKINKNSQIILDGKIPTELIQKLSDKGITFVRNINTFFEDLETNPKNLKFVFVLSKNIDELVSLFNINYSKAAELIKTVEYLEKFEYIEIVNSEATLKKSISNIKNNGFKPITIFNKKDNSLFGKNPVELGLNDYITCNSFELKDYELNGKVTTDFVFLSEFVRAMEKSKSLNLENTDKYWQYFSKYYNELISEKNNQDLTVTLIIGGTLTGSAGYLLYQQLNDK